MTANRSPLQDQFLADLQAAAPIPVTRSAEQPAAAVSPAEDTPTVALRLTPWRWARPSLSSPLGGKRVEVNAGPLRISLTGFDR